MYLAIEYCTDLCALSSSLTATAQSILGACVKPVDDLSTGMVSSPFLGLRRDVHKTLAAEKSLETARNLPEVFIDVAALETTSQARSATSCRLRVCVLLNMRVVTWSTSLVSLAATPGWTSASS